MIDVAETFEVTPANSTTISLHALNVGDVSLCEGSGRFSLQGSSFVPVGPKLSRIGGAICLPMARVRLIPFVCQPFRPFWVRLSPERGGYSFLLPIGCPVCQIASAYFIFVDEVIRSLLSSDTIGVRCAPSRLQNLGRGLMSRVCSIQSIDRTAAYTAGSRRGMMSLLSRWKILKRFLNATFGATLCDTVLVSHAG